MVHFNLWFYHTSEMQPNPVLFDIVQLNNLFNFCGIGSFDCVGNFNFRLPSRIFSLSYEGSWENNSQINHLEAGNIHLFLFV